MRDLSVLSSRDNPRVKRWAKLVRDGRFRKKEGSLIIEGPHLVSAALDRALKPICVLASESGIGRPEIESLIARSHLVPIVLADGIFRSVVDAETPPGIAAEIGLPQSDEPRQQSCVFLEMVQDAGNVGAIIRSAAALGAGTVIVDQACADPWSAKALRAGMGGHFALHIRTVPSLQAELERFAGRVICTVPRGGAPLRQADLSGRLGWVFGSEGRGLSAGLQKEADLLVSIATAPGTESLNVAATAAICLYEAATRQAGT